MTIESTAPFEPLLRGVEDSDVSRIRKPGTTEHGHDESGKRTT
jgi:hypothetical protein